jgi:hypothetical protein
VGGTFVAVGAGGAVVAFSVGGGLVGDGTGVGVGDNGVGLADGAEHPPASMLSINKQTNVGISCFASSAK